MKKAETTKIKKSEFVEIPKPCMVRVGPLRYRIVYEEMIDDFDSLGKCDHDELSIHIKLVKHDQMRLSLLHEIMHAAFFTVNGGKKCVKCNHEDKITEEHWITSVSPILLDILCRNPEVQKYLTVEHESYTAGSGQYQSTNVVYKKGKMIGY